MKSVKQPVRMCVSCRNRFLQKELYRLQCVDSKLTLYRGFGRSFYVCRDCVESKKFLHYIARICKISKTEAKNYILHFPFYI